MAVEFEDSVPEVSIIRKLNTTVFSKPPPFLTKLLLKTKLIKNENQAHTILIIIVVLGILITLYNFGLFRSIKNYIIQHRTIYREDLTPEELEQLPPDVLKTLPTRNK